MSTTAMTSERVTPNDIKKAMRGIRTDKLPVPLDDAIWFHNPRNVYPQMVLSFKNGQTFSLHLFEHGTRRKAAED